ncbi:MAG: 50S ribosomal protein L22 [Clostridia bacterium]|nr:50S ribosomal protein L22 [Clostridia bacterium]
MRPHATAKNIRISPYKVRAVLDVIRGKSYIQAVALLKSMNKSSCEPILKVVNSAAANAENNLGMNKDTLYVAACYADQGFTMKRMMPRAKGRGVRILKRTSHITVILDAQK